MQISQHILVFICAIGIFQGFLLAGLVCFHPKSDRSVNIFLAFFIIFVSLTMSFPLMLKLTSWKNTYFFVVTPTASAPLLYLYIRSFKERITWKKALPHLSWYFIFLVPAYLNLHALAEEFPDATEIPKEAFHKPSIIIFNYLRLAQSVCYYFLARRTLMRYQRSIKQLFSETSNFDLQWTRYLVNGFLLIISFGIVFFSLMVRYPEHFNELLLVNMTIATPYIYLATYKGVLQPSIWQLQAGKYKAELEEEMHGAADFDLQKSGPAIADVVKTRERDDRLSGLVGKIVGLMEQDKIYQETELTLQNLADKLQAPSYQVSQAINDGMNKTFYDLINHYRVEEAKRLLLDPKNSNYTILSVGFEAGFNSKTTFNTVFKKFTGQTPTDYRAKKMAASAE